MQRARGVFERILEVKLGLNSNSKPFFITGFWSYFSNPNGTLLNVGRSGIFNVVFLDNKEPLELSCPLFMMPYFSRKE